MILTTHEMKALEQRAFESGLTAESLMDEAGREAAMTVMQFFPSPGVCQVYYGKGNNGGDALVAAKHLTAAGWRIELRSKHYQQQLGMLPRKKLREAQSLPQIPANARQPKGPLVILDGLLGIGFHGELRDPVLAAAREINETRLNQNAYVFSLDLPTGLNSDTGEAAADCVIADVTIAIGYAKRGHVSDRAANYVGRLARAPLTPLENFAPEAGDDSVLATPQSLAGLLPRRQFDSHKSVFGRTGIVAGSRGYTGAASMCAAGALRAGAGLVTLYVRETVYNIIAATAPPEVMVQPVASYDEVLERHHDALAIGPGLGREHDGEIRRLISECPAPVVIDADAINAIASEPGILDGCAGPRLVTPHPGEMNRLSERKNQSRQDWAIEFIMRHPATLLLKGSRTIVGENGRPLSFNTTGSPGMSTGGMGDILTGVCVALLGQKLSSYDAARTGTWVCGRAAELAIFSGEHSEESLIATDLLKELGHAFQQLRTGCY